ncbi:hypothetical protein ACI65C_006212 [Semiaphis heraclei]
MTASNGFIIGDGSWNLQIYVSDLQVERTLRVKGDLHIGGVMLRLVEDLVLGFGRKNLIRHYSINQRYDFLLYYAKNAVITVYHLMSRVGCAGVCGKLSLNKD